MSLTPSSETLFLLCSRWMHTDRKAEFLFLSFLAKISARTYLNLVQAGSGEDTAFILHLETCVHFKLECKLGVVNGFSLAGQSNSSHRGAGVISICEPRRCRAELQPALPVQQEPCWQSCAGSGADPWGHLGCWCSPVSYSTSSKSFAVIDCSSYGSTVW